MLFLIYLIFNAHIAMFVTVLHKNTAFVSFSHTVIVTLEVIVLYVDFLQSIGLNHSVCRFVWLLCYIRKSDRKSS